MSDEPIEQVTRGERYYLNGYGLVEVVDFSRRISAIDADGVADETVLVQFNSSPTSNHVTDRDLHTINARAFWSGIEQPSLEVDDD